MDFIVRLLPLMYRRYIYDFILVIIDRYFKIVYLIPYN